MLTQKSGIILLFPKFMSRASIASITPYIKLYGRVRLSLMVLTTILTLVLPQWFIFTRQDSVIIVVLFVVVCIYGPGSSPGTLRLKKRSTR